MVLPPCVSFGGSAEGDVGERIVGGLSFPAALSKARAAVTPAARVSSFRRVKPMDEVMKFSSSSGKPGPWSGMLARVLAG
ncbi:hypothetical protein [Pseudomonas sp. NPDC089734]|uniref:hypothetical protein n=1 Tax=Pseudomonas sp. NPDC089734 TaxID=3364469 RepID=UPI0037F3551D